MTPRSRPAGPPALAAPALAAPALAAPALLALALVLGACGSDGGGGGGGAGADHGTPQALAQAVGCTGFQEEENVTANGVVGSCSLDGEPLAVVIGSTEAVPPGLLGPGLQDAPYEVRGEGWSVLATTEQAAQDVQGEVGGELAPAAGSR
ncbi:hypothetical protein [Vallicoccus soli]|uniref:DUF333 domain-containing protein n=1 Tax=Vallicoccus soli TaxID=2339232 RepID=A0A3A3YNH2_9ACTN|nr:hypothetical protein [Vallicoccus soli]RJK92941.1 hypothetical protein D5H78_17650 [Vallicoccus soli]